MSNLLKFLLLLGLVFLLASNTVKCEDENEAVEVSSEESAEETSEESTTEETTDEDEEEEVKIKVNIEKARVFIFANGVKVGRANIDVKSMSESLGKLAEIGTDIDTYEISHRGIVLTELESIDEEVKQITSKQDGGYHIIPYRYLANALECDENPFLGFSCIVSFKKGTLEDSYKTTLALTFGHCSEGMNMTELTAFEGIVELLIAAHKEMLADKVRAADEAAEQYNYYNSLYDDSVNKRNFAEQIPELQDKLDDKNGECEGLQKEFDTSKSDYENQQNIINENKTTINSLKSEIVSLQSKKAALEAEQIARHNASVTHEDRKKQAEAHIADIRNALAAIVRDVDPYAFDGKDCLDNNTGNLLHLCRERLNRIN